MILEMQERIRISIIGVVTRLRAGKPWDRGLVPG
jgi:hypothetical protein